VSRYDGKSFMIFTTAQGLASNNVRSILEDKIGNLWFGTDGGGVSRYDGKTFMCFTKAQGLANNAVSSIVEDKSGNLWFSNFGGGLSRYDGKSFMNFTTAQGLASYFVFSIAEDKIGNLWFGSQGGGVSRYDGKSFMNFTKAQGLADNVYSIVEDKSGNLWFGTIGDGVSRYDGKSFTNFTTAQGLANNFVQSIAEDKNGNFWFGTAGGGVSRYDGKSFTNFTTTQGLANNFVQSILEDKSGNLWFGTYGGGVSRYDGKSFMNFTTAQGLASNYAWSIAEDKNGNLWFGTEGGGVSRLLFKDVALLANKTEKVKAAGPVFFDNFTTINGLANDVVYKVVEDKQGNIILGTNLGFTLIPAKATALPFSEIKPNLEYYNSSTGYPVKDINANAMFCDSKGIIWAGTGSDKTGLVRFDYASLDKKEHIQTPKLIIQSVKIKDENICWYNLQSKNVRKKLQDSSTALLQEFLAYGKTMTASENDSILKRFGDIQFTSISKFYPLPQNLVLPYAHNQIAFEFTAIEVEKPFLIKYQYMLEGYDKDWSPVTNRTNANFGNIHEGTYTFKLKAQGANGVWCEQVSYTFKVLPPWYRTWWAYSIYALLFLSGLGFFSKWRERNLRAEKEKLEKTVEERTSEVILQKETVERTLTQLQSTQAQLIQSEKLASLGELTAGIAHEIQNPLNFVNNFAEVSTEMLVEMDAELEKGDIHEAKAISADLQQNLSKINHHGQRASAIVKGMLEHSRTSTGVKEPTDLNALADEYLRLAYHGLRARDSSFNAVMETHFDPDLPLVSVIPQDIGRVLLNLINNAFYAVNDKAKQGIEGYSPMVTVGTKKLENAIEISVQDNGNGIPETIKDKIFQPFFTTKPTGQGTGLGLSLAYDIVTKGHGGTLEVESTVANPDNGGENLGSVFIISLPFQTI
jgi:signal transduction histidine kinase/ligand-binding sensor domain-containing protein